MNINTLHDNAKQAIAQSQAGLTDAIGAEYDAAYGKIIKKAVAFAETGKPFSKSSPEYKSLMADVKELTGKCGSAAAGIIARGQIDAAAAGRKDAFGFCGEPSAWNTPDLSEYAENAGNVVIPGRKPVTAKEFLSHYSEKSHKQIEKVLSTGIKRKDGADRIAARIRNIGLADKHHAQLTAKTETMKFYNDAQKSAYSANDEIVKGMVWRCRHSRHTCAACWSMDGSFFLLDEPIPERHPGCNCIMLPALKNGDGAKVFNPEGAFGKLPEEEKINILGEKGYDLYNEGKLSLKDFAAVGENGAVIKAAPGALEEMAEDNLLTFYEMPKLEAALGRRELEQLEIGRANALRLLEERFKPNQINDPDNLRASKIFCPAINFDKDNVPSAKQNALSESRVRIFAKLVESAFPIKAFDFEKCSYYPEWLQKTPEMYCLRSGFSYGFTQGESTLRSENGNEILDKNMFPITEERSRENQLRFACIELGGGIHANTDQIQKEYDKRAHPESRVAALSLHQYTQDMIKQKKIKITSARKLYRGLWEPLDPAKMQSIDSWSTDKDMAGEFGHYEYQAIFKKEADPRRILFVTRTAAIAADKNAAFNTGFPHEQEVVMLYDPNLKPTQIK